jgi:hypothetical protein
MEIYREIGKVLERVSPSKERAPRGRKSPSVAKKKVFLSSWSLENLRIFVFGVLLIVAMFIYHNIVGTGCSRNEINRMIQIHFCRGYWRRFGRRRRIETLREILLGL